MLEVDVKAKYAKKRLDDAKAAGIRTAPARPPVQFDPPPPGSRGRDRERNEGQVNPPRAGGDRDLESLKKQVAEQEATVKVKQDAAKKAEALSAAAQADLEKILDIAMRGRVRPGTIEAAQAKAQDAKAVSEKASVILKEAQAALEKSKARLKGLEK